MIWIMLIVLVIVVIDIINLERKMDRIVKVVDEIFEDKQEQINDLYSKIDKNRYYDEP